jgi:hypothetical protein
MQGCVLASAKPHLVVSPSGSDKWDSSETHRGDPRVLQASCPNGMNVPPVPDVVFTETANSEAGKEGDHAAPGTDLARFVQ